MSVGFHRFYQKLSLNRKSVGNWLIWSIKIWPKEILSRKSVFRQIYQSRFPVILIASVLNSEYKTFSHIHMIIRYGPNRMAQWWPILEAPLCVRLFYLCDIEHQRVLMNSSTMNEIRNQEESRDDQRQLDMLSFWSGLHFEFRSVKPSILNKFLSTDSY